MFVCRYCVMTKGGRDGGREGGAEGGRETAYVK